MPNTHNPATLAPKIGVIGIPDAWSSEILREHLVRKTGFGIVIPIDQVSIDLSQNTAMFGEYNLCEFDALIVKKVGKHYSPNSLDRLGMLSWIEGRGVKIFSSAYAIKSLLNRLDCTLRMHEGGVPMPATCVTENLGQASQFIREHEEVVLKPFYSTKARGMEVLTANQEDLMARLERYQQEHPMVYLQRKIEIPGKDLGLMFLGGEYMGCYARNASGKSWNTTIHDGGHYSEYHPREETISIARKAQSLFGLSFTTVDIVETDKDQDTIVFEVSAFGGFKGAKEGLGIDIAEQYVDYVLSHIE